MKGSWVLSMRYLLRSPSPITLSIASFCSRPRGSESLNLFSFPSVPFSPNRMDWGLSVDLP
ncbi:hypothetical protein Lal_00021450 [Lupinus albus]|uniref:Uncharacterized protein n=1 Tax=Lupinus albus TaxID=3870 RepID=A0A6A4NUT0_LUPAL|nr:hypothetical protein Lalb_Chr20g0114351 [Lupinus albus]KAF1881472.1 hypothetical protein Lal_00021450 [Lupinus albus]